MIALSHPQKRSPLTYRQTAIALPHPLKAIALPTSPKTAIAPPHSQKAITFPKTKERRTDKSAIVLSRIYSKN
ncbi:MAG: hypothetical protein PT119_24430 [Aphanizomenon gracile PMC627.10]|nr:hypothetical protein [Aphanizomenon gracile PMC627.10]